MHPNSTERTKTSVLGPMGWIRCVHWKKFRRDFVARTFALIVPVRRVFNRVSSGDATMSNAPKQHGIHQTMSLGSNGVDREHSLPKIPMRLRGTNICIN